MIKAAVLKFAYETHESTNHKYDDGPYSVHLTLALMFGQKYIEHIKGESFTEDYHKRVVLNAIACHDLIEDCRITYNDICHGVGKAEAELVYAVTDQKGKNRQERHNAMYYSEMKKVHCATYVKLCDWLANIYYSRQTKSRMLDCYREEFDKTSENLKTADSYYPVMIEEARKLLFD